MAYGAALDHEAVHVLQHASFLGTALLVWATVLGPARVRADRCAAVLLAFTLGLQNVALAALLTFAGEPWYDAYRETTPAFGLDPLTDQHLAGAVMWVPAGFIHLGITLAVAAAWVRGSDAINPAPARA